jgi:hypothetical protein
VAVVTPSRQQPVGPRGRGSHAGGDRAAVVFELTVGQTEAVDGHPCEAQAVQCSLLLLAAAPGELDPARHGAVGPFAVGDGDEVQGPTGSAQVVQDAADPEDLVVGVGRHDDGAPGGSW